MKFMSVGTITKPLSPEQRQDIMPREVPRTLELYLDSKIEQFWFRQDKPGVIFLMDVESRDEAQAIVEAMPLVTAGFMTHELIHVGPLAPLRMLLPAK